MKKILLLLAILFLTSCWQTNVPKQELRYGSICKDTVVTTTRIPLLGQTEQVQGVHHLCRDTIVVVEMQVVP